MTFAGEFSTEEIQRQSQYNICVCIRNWPLPIGAFQDQCKQTMVNKRN